MILTTTQEKGNSSPLFYKWENRGSKLASKQPKLVVVTELWLEPNSSSAKFHISALCLLRCSRVWEPKVWWQDCRTQATMQKGFFTFPHSLHSFPWPWSGLSPLASSLLTAGKGRYPFWLPKAAKSSSALPPFPPIAQGWTQSLWERAKTK